MIQNFLKQLFRNRAKERAEKKRKEIEARNKLLWMFFLAVFFLVIIIRILTKISDFIHFVFNPLTISFIALMLLVYTISKTV